MVDLETPNPDFLGYNTYLGIIFILDWNDIGDVNDRHMCNLAGVLLGEGTVLLLQAVSLCCDFNTGFS